MVVQNWGALQKSADDDETIEEAITRLIAVHEGDSTSHLGEGESLEAHKTADVIDHPASSVFDDKMAFDRNSASLSFENFGLYDKSTAVEYLAINSLYFYSSNTSNRQWFYASTQDMWLGSEFLFSKNPRFFIKFMLSNITSQDTYIVVGERDEGRGFGVKIINNTLYAIYYKSDFSEVAQSIMTISANTVYKLECRVIDGVNLEIWVDNILVGTVENADFPTTNNFAYSLPWVDFKSTTTTARELFIRDFYWEADL